MSLSTTDQWLFRTILKRVSRSFYLTIAVLPSPVRTQIGLAYLLARAADTLADSGNNMDDESRKRFLVQFKKDVQQGKGNAAHIDAIKQRVDMGGFVPDEAQLLIELGRCFSLLEKMTPDDQTAISRVLSILIGGMEFDLETFPRADMTTIHALSELQDFEFYTYSVAGCVGEFWTRLMCVHLSAFSSWDQAVMSPLAIRFGKGLQMVNILRDIAEDLRKGRCYVPLVLLRKAGLSPEDLLDEGAWESFRPLYRELLSQARDHLDQGWRYTLSIPRLQVRVRLACMWPILIGIQTLQRLSVASNVLASSHPIKISRPEVYRILGGTGLSGGSTIVGNIYWGYWRKRIV
ncbi:MAG: squalene/phytoene synthase family protein [Nitrospira sp.]|nr:squalene/phytoene synthase family protein [Nitrospira sp.]MCA9465884.1 squalene/phytoene synthase family protein [Nitrospira sp.]MCA9476827.1 squalene/phytoene synthase family protein [Nitrospira sp.]MCA9479596.1 squalene/phytoene synthase family protein [Nitrospira sp.]MCB9712001.1 squalene/phytoene synthase family protein [Nitrospiraceae bacterium]